MLSSIELKTAKTHHMDQKSLLLTLPTPAHGGSLNREREEGGVETGHPLSQIQLFVALETLVNGHRLSKVVIICPDMLAPLSGRGVTKG